MPNGHYPDERQLLFAVLRDTQGNFKAMLDNVQHAARSANKKDDGNLLRDAWMQSMHRAFTAAYKSDPRSVTVFAKPLKKQFGSPVTKTPYGRGEFGFDLAVIEMRTEDAPYHKVHGEPTKVKVVSRHLWQVESEIRNDATRLAEDLGKLTGGAAPCKLLVTLTPAQRDKGTEWRKFIERAAKSVPGQLYVAMMASYGSKNGRKTWCKGAPEIHVYELNRTPALELVKCLPAVYPS